jgi:N-methylhydantoinase A/oxoprolinase/acetone carboxylase beta subunit
MRTIGIDTGGTFTDLTLYDEDCEVIRVTKIPPHDRRGPCSKCLSIWMTRP